MAWLISEFGRFVQFVLLVSVSMKVGDDSALMDFGWAAALWPVWVVASVVLLLALVTLPYCVCSFLRVERRRSALMLTWITVSSLCLSAALCISMLAGTSLLDKDDCPSDFDHNPHSKHCAQKLQETLLPWVLLLPGWGVVTLVLKSRLAQLLHEAWYAEPSGRTDAERFYDELAPDREEPTPQEAPPPAPEVLFKVTPTFYSREPPLEEAGFGSLLQGSARPSLPSREPRFSAPGALGVLNSHHSSVSLGPLARTTPQPSIVGFDPSQSIMSARGANYAALVEEDQTCFICYDAYPNAVLLECGHAGVCVECASRVIARRNARCPVCRTFVGMVAQLHPERAVAEALFASGRAGSRSSRDLELGDAPALWPAASRRLAVAVELVRRWERPRRRRPRVPPAVVQEVPAAEYVGIG